MSWNTYGREIFPSLMCVEMSTRYPLTFGIGPVLIYTELVTDLHDVLQGKTMFTL